MLEYGDSYEKSNISLAAEKLLDNLLAGTKAKAGSVSGEKLDLVFDKLNLKNKSMLTADASGDQVLNALLSGSRDITVANPNAFSECFVEYKFAAIMAFDFETFNKVFAEGKFFEWNTYKKLSHELSEDVRPFWDTIMLDLGGDATNDEFNAKALEEAMVTFNTNDKHSKFYIDEKTYNKLQKILKDESFNIDYITSEIQDLPSLLEQNYDYINLSNLYDMAENKDEFNEFVEMLYDKNLKANGAMVVYYDKNSKGKLLTGQFDDIKFEQKQLSAEANADTMWIIKKAQEKPLDCGRDC